MGAGGTEDPLEDVRAIFTTLGMTTTQRDAHNIMNKDNFYYIGVDDARSFIKIWNHTSRAVATKVSMPT